MPDLVHKIANLFTEKIIDSVPFDGARIKIKLLFHGKIEPTLWLETDIGIKCKIGKVTLELDFYRETKDFPFRLYKYRDPNSPKSIAELATSDVEILGKKYRIEFIAPGAGKNIPAGTTVSVRTIQLD